MFDGKLLPKIDDGVVELTVAVFTSPAREMVSLFTLIDVMPERPKVSEIFSLAANASF